MKSKNVILVGIPSEACGPEFLCPLRADGYSLIESPAEDLPSVVQNHPEATIVVYNRPGADTGRRALAILSASSRHIPLIVLVDMATFEEYYDFMCQGAYDYFELEEDPVAIERAIRYASTAAPLSPAPLAAAAVA